MHNIFPAISAQWDITINQINNNRLGLENMVKFCFEDFKCFFFR